MDMSLVTSLLSNQAASGRSSVAATMMQKNAEMERSTVLTLLGGAEQAASQANLAAGVGGKVDMLA